MEFTFGIITDGNNDNNLEIIIKSIQEENIPEYEIIIVGNSDIKETERIKIIKFNEKIKPMWITRKKNIITQESKYENIVYMHDYIYLLPGWYEGHLKFGNDFKVLMDKIINLDGTRYRDWCLWENPFNLNGRHLIDYRLDNLTKYMYISGAYWISKKSFMLEFPLNENRTWGQGEDVEWSRQIKNIIKFKMNINSSVKLLKQKEKVFKYGIEEDYEELKKLK